MGGGPDSRRRLIYFRNREKAHVAAVEGTRRLEGQQEPIVKAQKFMLRISIRPSERQDKGFQTRLGLCF